MAIFSEKFPRPRHVTQGHTRVTQARTELSSIKISWKIVMMPKIEKVSYFNCSTLCCCIWWKGEKAEFTQPWWSCLQKTKRSSSQFFLRRQTPVDMHILKACYVFLACRRRKSFWRSNDGCGRRFQLIYFFWKRVMFLARRRRKQFGALIVAAVGGSSWNTC